MQIIIESGLMYSVSVVVFFAMYLASNNAQYGVSDCVSSPPPPPAGVLMYQFKLTSSIRSCRSLYVPDLVILGTL